jgi:hypothetical protein
MYNAYLVQIQILCLKRPTLRSRRFDFWREGWNGSVNGSVRRSALQSEISTAQGEVYKVPYGTGQSSLRGLGELSDGKRRRALGSILEIEARLFRKIHEGEIQLKPLRPFFAPETLWARQCL